MPTPSVLVVGSGISGLACAHALARGGIRARVADRGRRPGGRMSGRTLHGRAVDLGASYFTAEPGSAFEAVVQDWVGLGIARSWTDTFSVADPSGIQDSKSGPMRYAAPSGLRELVIRFGHGLDIEQERDIESVSDELEAGGTRYDAVVLAMPDPQARRILGPGTSAYQQLQDAGEWEPTIAVALGWDARRWPDELHAAFVNDSPEVGFIADDGDRRGDGAAVIVAHSTTDFARHHLDEPDAASAPIVEAVAGILGIKDAPEWTFVQRWSFARPSAPHDDPYLLADGIGVCGDAWGGKSSVGAAWRSGDALGQAIAADLVD